MIDPLRFLHTVRYLRPQQVVGRAWLYLYHPRPELAPAPPLRSASQPWRSIAWRPASMLGPTRFRFLHEEHVLPFEAGWDDPSWSRLWRYNLHYFEDLDAQGASARHAWHRELVGRWITENPAGGGTGWEPYCLSLRIVNWAKWMLRTGEQDPDVQHSLAIQTRYLRRRLEIHLLGNHLWANLKALFFAAALFEGAEADDWLQVARELFRGQLAEQVLPDGGHFERSPMYHATLLEDLLDLLQLAELYPARFDAAERDSWRETAARMLNWLAVMTHPDGQIALFNDAAFGIAPPLSPLIAYAVRLGVRPVANDLCEQSVFLQSSGYARLSKGPVTLIADVGEIGPAYLPGHAHADTLAFELSINGQRLFVDTGTSRYDVCAERLRQRGTAAHNTVELNGTDSSEVWSSFRVARRARPRDVRVGSNANVVWLSAAHDGYRRLPGRPLHRRTFDLTAHELRIQDEIEGPFRTATARFLVHPAWRIQVQSGGGRLLGAERHLDWSCTGCARATVTRRPWTPEFGCSYETESLNLDFRGPRLETCFIFG